MKARRKGTNCPFKTVDKIQLKDSDILYDANVMEFEQDIITTHDTLSTVLKTFDQVDEEKHWQDVRERAAIAAMQGFLSRQTYKNGLTTLAKDSVRLANFLVEELKKLSV